MIIDDSNQDNKAEDSKHLEANMPAAVVVDLYEMLERHDIKVWVDGGWAVDALIGVETRPHCDLDIALETRNLTKLRHLLAQNSYEEQLRDDSSAWNFILADDSGHEVDVHAFTLDQHGDGIYGPIENGDVYPEASLTGMGTINGLPVRCISPEWLVKFHSGYELSETDYHDVRALCSKFNVELPEEYRPRGSDIDAESQGEVAKTDRD